MTMQLHRLGFPCCCRAFNIRKAQTMRLHHLGLPLVSSCIVVVLCAAVMF